METIAIIIGLFLLFGYLKNQSLSSLIPQLNSASSSDAVSTPVISNQLPTPNGIPQNLQVQTRNTENAPSPWTILRSCGGIPPNRPGPIGLTGGPVIAQPPIIYGVTRSNITGGVPNVPSARSVILSAE